MMFSRLFGCFLLVVLASTVACGGSATRPAAPAPGQPAPTASSAPPGANADDDDGTDVYGHSFVGPGASGSTGPADAH